MVLLSLLRVVRTSFDGGGVVLFPRFAIDTVTRFDVLYWCDGAQYVCASSRCAACNIQTCLLQGSYYIGSESSYTRGLGSWGG